MANTIIGEPIKQWQERKTRKLTQQFKLQRLDYEANLAKAQIMLEMAKNGQQQEYNLDRIAMQNMKNSWKDELILLVFITPIILAFVPGMDEQISVGFAAIAKMPKWYIGIVVGMVVVIYGMRGLLTAYIQRSFTAIKGK